MQSTAIQAIAVNPDEGKYVSVMGDTYRILVGGAQTNNAFAVIDMRVPPNGGPGPHAHTDVQESFYIIEGEITVTTETQTYKAAKGAFISIPKGGLVHKFKNETDTVAHMLCTVVPSGMEEMFTEIGRPVEAGAYLPPPEMTPELEQHMQAVAEKYGQKLYPPDYLNKDN